MFWIRETDNSRIPSGFFKILDFHRFLKVVAMCPPLSSICGGIGMVLVERHTVVFVGVEIVQKD